MGVTVQRRRECATITTTGTPRRARIEVRYRLVRVAARVADHPRGRRRGPRRCACDRRPTDRLLGAHHRGVTPALESAVMNLQLPARLTAQRAHASTVAQADRHHDPLGAEATATTDVPGRRSSRLNAWRRARRPPSQAAELHHPGSLHRGRRRVDHNLRNSRAQPQPANALQTRAERGLSGCPFTLKPRGDPIDPQPRRDLARRDPVCR